MTQFYMQPLPPVRAREIAVVSLAAVALSILMTWPLAAGFGRLGRTTGADGQFSIWNVSWVARTIVADPAHLFDANIFFPHRLTLAYSEANLLEGLLAVPVYWATKNPFATLNAIVLLAFASAFVAMYVLARHVSASRGGAAVAGAIYAFCPYVFAHTSHIQLLMTGGIPLALLLLHRIAERPSIARGAWLGFALVLQGLACAYYGIFAGLTVGFSALVLATLRGMWRSREYWTAIAAGAAVAFAGVGPFFIPYLRVQQESGFARTLDDARRYSALPQDYIVSSAHAHGWLLAIASRFEHWREVLFPGFAALLIGGAGLVWLVRHAHRDGRARETLVLYGLLGTLAFWASFGPAAGLYRIMFELPLFSFLRAPSRFGLLVVLVLALFAAMAIAPLERRLAGRARAAAAVILLAATILDLNILPFPWERAPEIPISYKALGRLPAAPLAEFPFYGDRVVFPLHAQYMVFSTAHWLPMVNGYSDVIPNDFREAAVVLAGFPSPESFHVLARHRVRYIGVHWDMYGPRADDVRAALAAYRGNLETLAADRYMTLYEIVRYP